MISEMTPSDIFVGNHIDFYHSFMIIFFFFFSDHKVNECEIKHFDGLHRHNTKVKRLFIFNVALSTMILDIYDCPDDEYLYV